MSQRPWYIDTSYLIALVNAKDQDHDHAALFSKSLSISDELITSMFVVMEFFNYFSDHRVRVRAADFFHRMEEDPRVKILPVSVSTFDRGKKIYERFSDKDWSLVDCISFQIMEDMRLTDSLTFDRHFLQAGFRSPFL